MGLSQSLLIAAAITALVPVAAIGFRAPTRIADLEKMLVSGAIVAIAAGAFVHWRFDLDFFGLAHYGYLLAVVSFPLLTTLWIGLAIMRGDRRRFHDLFGALGALVALVGLYATHVEPNWLRVDESVVRADVRGALRIGVVADLQSPNVGDHERAAIDRLLDRNPHMVVVPGDWYQGHLEELEANRGDFVALLRELAAATEIVLVVSGDSDHDMALEPIAAEAGAVFLDNRIGEVTANGLRLRVVGLAVAESEARSEVLTELGPTDAFTLVVAHRPDVVYDLPEGADVDLVVSGHTHGGQVAIPLIGPPVTFSGIPRSAAAGGLSLVNGYPLYVSTGVGIERHQAPQVRFAVRPSVGIIDVVPR